jgi:hypothetical protein
MPMIWYRNSLNQNVLISECAGPKWGGLILVMGVTSLHNGAIDTSNLRTGRKTLESESYEDKIRDWRIFNLIG